MKKKIILPFLAIIALSSCNVNIEKVITSTTPILLTDDVNQDLAYLRNIASSYNKDESLSFYNYFTNALNLPIYNDNTILYNNKVYKIEGQDISFKLFKWRRWYFSIKYQKLSNIRYCIY